MIAMYTIGNRTGVPLADIRLGVAHLLSEAQATAWEALRRQEAGTPGIPVARFARFVERLSDLDRALAHLERRAETGARAAG